MGLVLACWLGAAVPALRPQQGYDLSPIMLWRPQKVNPAAELDLLLLQMYLFVRNYQVGSSTILPILESFSFRMNLKLRPPRELNRIF